MANEKLDRHHQIRIEKHGHYLKESQKNRWQKKPYGNGINM